MALTFHISHNIGFVEFDQEDSKVNVLSAGVLHRLANILEEIKRKTSLEALVFLSRKKDVFIAGADIKEIEQITESKDGEEKSCAGQEIFNVIEDLPIPTIAVIDGAALGGGCEIALACQYRLATFNEKVKIGLPEVNLGILPGFGGTYRLPRIVGLPEGLKMILSGKPVDGKKALKIGLVDRLVPQSKLEDFILEFTADIRAKKFKPNKYARRRKKGLQGILEGSLLGQAFIFYQSSKSVLKTTQGFYPAPLKAIGVVQKNFYLPRERGLEVEAKAFGELAVTENSKNLVKVFYLSEKYRKLNIPGAEKITTRPVQKAGVLGAGVMGGGIAQLLSAKGIWTRLKDINYDAIAKGLQAAWKIYRGALRRRKMSNAQASQGMARITGTLDYSGFTNAGVVIEAVVENMEVKKKIFKELSEAAREDAVLMSNTSALSVTEMAKQTRHPERVVGFHFFNPVHRMPLVEIITTPQTSPETIATGLELAKRLGKTPILVKDSCGFVVNRILLAYVNEAGRILEETGDLTAIDRLATRFGMPMGPFRLSDEVGLDVGIKVLSILADEFGERFKPVEIFERVYHKGLLGKKSAKGFYVYKNNKEIPNQEIKNLAVCRAPRPVSPEDDLDRMILTMVNEAARCLQDGIVDEPDTIDVGMIFGTGFPPFRGGLLRYADQKGMEYIVSRLLRMERDLKAERFKPASFLQELRKRGRSFYNS